MNVLFVVSECAPLIKTGGLADVAGALPGALAVEGCSVRVLMPAYSGLLQRLRDPHSIYHFHDLFGGPGELIGGHADGLDLMLLNAPQLYDRAGSPYSAPDGSDWPDNPTRFAALAWAAAEIGHGNAGDGWRPDVVHAHDWQAGLTPVYLGSNPNRPATVTTIHNVAYQGNFPAALRPRLRLPPEGFTSEGYEFWLQVGFLKAGLVYADAITTVSPTYARELTTPQFGMGLEGVIAARADRLSGILNGIDLGVWNPETDPNIQPYTSRTLHRRAANRQALVSEFGLGEDTTGPLFGVISRLTYQKGLDLLLEAIPRIIERGGKLVLLGSGDAGLEDAFSMAAAAYPHQIGVRIGYDEPLSHRIYAGCDALMVPSRFEPCGLTQLYALRYGALPVVATTGGLADTVIDANDAACRAGVATGFQFAPGSAAALGEAIGRVCDFFADQKLWHKMQRNAMKHPVGWETSAAAYRQLYDNLVGSAA